MADQTTQAASSATGGLGFNPIEAGAMIANTIAGINDMNKRRKFEQALSLLSNAQQHELNKKMLAAQTESERLAILSQSMTDFLIANQTANSRNNIFVFAIAGGLGVVLLIMAVYYSVKKK